MLEKNFNKIFLSTGLSNMKKVEMALKVLCYSQKFQNLQACSKQILKKKK